MLSAILVAGTLFPDLTISWPVTMLPVLAAGIRGSPWVPGMPGQPSWTVLRRAG